LSGPAGNVYDKYASRNPIERRLVGRFLRTVRDLVSRSGAREAHEVGCGEGELSLMLARDGLRMRGSDVSGEVVAEARRRAAAAAVEVTYRPASIATLDPETDAAELIVCCEVLEHLLDPEAGLETIALLGRPWLVVSVPREPLWRALNVARGKYLAELGNTPGHVGHWSRADFLSFLRRRVDVVEARSPLPWTVALCRARR
jgi:2-polyprenyl-3-methyl-5-hydroxy-6-metoxy-1,4-benzoquinol methylase